MMKIFITAAAMLFSIVVSAQTYQWTDEKGVTHYSDKPINAKAEKIEIKVTKPKASTSVSETESASSAAASGKTVKDYPCERTGEQQPGVVGNPLIVTDCIEDK
ncbi:MAG: DUF4124 domain-containing protein [Oleiphilaceae bacterium]|nr:DUF4124 domain-containing protein [Oleiphilaceae bacterium]